MCGFTAVRSQRPYCPSIDILRPKGSAALEVAAIDMSKSYEKALRERVPHIDVVLDRFNV